MLSITISHPHLAHLRIPAGDALEQVFQLKPRYIRMGLYWSLIENTPGTYDFSYIQSALSRCEEEGQKVVLTVGMKAPRWPEFHLPRYLQGASLNTHEVQRALLHYVERAVQDLGQYNCVTHWQVENEPLDPSGPRQMLVPEELLQAEVEMVRSVDPKHRPCITTLWGNDYAARNTVAKVSAYADIIGFDLYYSQFAGVRSGKARYRGPASSEERLRSDIASAACPVWITELQAEPWEQNDTAYRSVQTPSMQPERITKYVARAKRLAPQEIFLWGYEYWLWKKLQGDTSYWEAASSAILGT